jgi:hypothetical protein
VTTALKPWEELGATAVTGPATYEKQFTAKATPKGQHVYLEIADVHQYAKVTLNGKDLGDHAFQPYRWDVTSALKAGENDLKIEVRAPAVNRMGGPPPTAMAAAAPAPGLTTAPPAGAGGAGAGARRRPGGAGAGGGAGAPPPAAMRPAAAPAPPPATGLLGEVKLVAH